MRRSFWLVAAFTVIYSWSANFSIGFVWDILYGPVQDWFGPNYSGPITQGFLDVQLAVYPSFWVFFPLLLILLILLSRK